MTYAPLVHAALAFVLAACPARTGPLVQPWGGPWLHRARTAPVPYAIFHVLRAPKPISPQEPADQPDSSAMVPPPSDGSDEAETAGTAVEDTGESAGPATAGPPSSTPEPPSDRPSPSPSDDAPAGGKTPPAPDAPLPDDLLAPTPEPTPHRRSAAPPAEAPRPGGDRPGFLPGNPVRAQVVVRGLFANVGLGKDPGPGGRMGGLRTDVGLSWNFVAVGAQVLAFGGLVERDDGRFVRAIVGGGPVLSLGRLAMVGRGVVDLRAGYAFGWAPVRDREGGRSSAAPHGPNVVLDLAIVARTSGGQAIHAGGLSLFYQGWVHDLRDQLPPAHMLGAGITYWFD
ncbi:MAG: hypothetical protein D6705_17850 [Deltaproteobacteria bacterium]|nr:MAG: hypothetical protein D6705_17850 [Deltaproteobacteria bacterium]